jgi:predicted nucleic acid-binding protein
MRGGLAQHIPAGALVGIDTPAFIYELEGNPAYARTVRPFFAGLELGSIRGVTSVVTLMELIVRPLQLHAPDVADSLEALLLAYPNLSVLDVTRSIVRRAAGLRARHRLRAMDSVQVATALQAGAVAFLTNDRGLRRVDEVTILVIDDYRDA